MTGFRRAFRAELHKAPNSLPLWLAVVGTITLEPGFLILHWFEVENFRLPEAGNPWTAFVLNHYNGINFMLLPLFVVIIASLVAYVEHRNQTWKHVFVQTVDRSAIYLTKVAYTFLLFAGAHTIFVLLLLVGGVVLGLIWPASGLLRYPPDWAAVGLLYSRTLLSILGLLGLQMAVSLRFRAFLVPLTVGILLYVGSTLILDSPLSPFNPYAFPTLYLGKTTNAFDPPVLLGYQIQGLYSVLYCLLFSLIGYWSFRRADLT